jgi:hypothetical protein
MHDQHGHASSCASSLARDYASLDASTAARIRRENADRQPYLPRSDAGERYARGDINTSKWQPSPDINPADVPEIPAFLRRAPRLSAADPGDVTAPALVPEQAEHADAINQTPADEQRAPEAAAPGAAS